ncbi:OmpA family protein [Porphyromonas sp.]
MKSLLLTLSLSALCSVASAQSTAQKASRPLTPADTLITLSEKDLMRAVRSVAEARLRSAEQPTTTKGAALSAEDLRMLKLQMLLSALGLGATAPSPAPVHTPAGNSLSYTYAPQYPSSGEPAQRDARLERLEQLMLLLLQRREAGRDPIVLSLPSASQHAAPAANSSSDSLLRVLQQEVIALRAAQQQQATDSVPSVAVEPEQPVSVAVPEPPAPVPQPQTVVRTDTVVVSHFKRQVFFALGKSELLPEARLALNEVYRILSTDAEMKLYLTGYSSPDGNAAQNERLSRLRSQAVLDYLTACGISADRLISVAGGIDRNTDLMSSARRVDIELKK